tara:strand:- start:308 stop:4009 length:3702 start_codon:yes stop_codon:yes gene_type:complete
MVAQKIASEAAKKGTQSLIQYLLKNIKPRFSKQGTTAAEFPLDKKLAYNVGKDIDKEADPTIAQIGKYINNNLAGPNNKYTAIEIMEALEPKLSNFKEKTGNKNQYILDEGMTSNANDRSQSVANMWVNYLVNKQTPKFPKELGNTSKDLVKDLDNVTAIKNNSDYDFVKLTQIFRTFPNSKTEQLPNAGQVLNYFNNKIPENIITTMTERMAGPAGYGHYGNDFPALEKSFKQSLTNYQKSNNLQKEIFKKLETTSPATLVNNEWFGKLDSSQLKQKQQETFVTYLDTIKGKEYLDVVPDDIIKKNLNAIPIGILRRTNPTNNKEWLYDFRFADSKRYKLEDNYSRSAVQNYMSADRYNSNFFTSPKKNSEISKRIDPKEGIINLASKMGMNAASQDIIKNLIRGQIYLRGQQPVLEDLKNQDSKITNLIKSKLDEQLPEARLQREYELDIKNNPQIVEGLQYLMNTMYPGTKSPQLFNRGHKFAQKRVANLMNVLPEGIAKQRATELLNQSGDVNMIQFQPALVNKPITTAVEQIMQDPKMNFTDVEKLKIDKLLKKLKTTSMFIDVKGQVTPYGANKEDPYAINRLTDKEFLELINILSKKNYRKIAEYVRGKGNEGIPEFNKFNKGGSVDYGEMKQVVPLLDPGESQHLNVGGKAAGAAGKAAVQYVKNQIMPSVLKNVSQIASKMLPKDTTNPFVVVDKNNLPIKDFKTQNEADKWLNTKGETVPEDEFYESIINYSVKSKDQIQSETVSTIQETPAMVYKTPDVIKNSPMEIAQGKQWLGILKKSGVSPKELDDTSIGPYLSIQAPNKKITKAELMETFDLVSPNFEVIALGKRDAGKMSKNIIDKFNQVKSNVQMSGTDQGVVNNFGAILQNTMTATTDKQLSSVSKQLNSLLKRAYGIDSALSSSDLATNTQIAAPIRSILGDLSELLKTRGASLTYESTPKHSGDQVLPGGNNYRELAFKWTPGSLRKSESGYIPSHSFGLKDERAQGIFVHSRLSDRTDNYGRKILFVEEIQSDMHQRAQKTLREGGTNVYKTREDKMIGVQPAIDEMTALQGKIDRILAVDPTNQALPSLYQKRESLAAKIQEIRDTMGSSGGGGTPEGPFQRSGDYGSFVMKYLLRLAKENNYDGVALSTGNIKNRRGYGSIESQKGHYGFYDKIMQKELKKLAKKYGIDYVNTVINDGKINWGNVPLLLLKNTDKVMEGFQAFKTGGLARENFVDVVPLL